jgi:hypothetical protein
MPEDAVLVLPKRPVRLTLLGEGKTVRRAAGRKLAAEAG